MSEPTVQQIFGDRLRLLREAQDLTQKQVAELLNVSRSTYTRYENGSSAPSLELTRRLAQLLANGDPRFIMQLTPTANTPIVADVTEPTPDIPTLAPDEKMLILYYRSLNEEQREKVLEELRERSLEQLAKDYGE